MFHFLIFGKENHINTIKPPILSPWGFPSGSAAKNLPAVWEPQETRVRSLGGEDPLEEGDEYSCNPLQYSCLENPHGQRSVAGYSPQRRKE